MDERNIKWLEDIEQLANELPNRHKNLFFNLKKTSFNRQIENLKKNIQDLDNYEIQVEVSRILASVHDAHTYVNLHIRYLCPVELMVLVPASSDIRFDNRDNKEAASSGIRFGENIYVVAASEEYKDILGCRIVSINDIDIDEIIEEYKTITSFENEYYFKSLMAKYLVVPEILYGLGIVDDIEEIKFEVETEDKEIISKYIKPVLAKNIVKEHWFDAAELFLNNTLPLYRQNPHLNYWFSFEEATGILYFKYNRCREMEDMPMCSFLEELIDFIETKDVDKLIIDFRNNSGGNSTLLEGFIKYISSCGKFDRKGSLFVITGRETFSSALLNVLSLKKKTSAVFVGEPTGGKPDCYGEVKSFKLNNYGLQIFYSTEYYDCIGKPSVMSFYPDINAQLTIEDYLNNEDPVIFKIKEIKV